MSPDRPNITRAEAIRLRKEEEQKRQEAQVKKRFIRSRPGSPKPPAERTPRKPIPVSKSPHSRRYDAASTRSVFGARPASTPSLSLPKVTYGPRWLSFLLSAACGLTLFILLGMDPFIVRSAEINGNLRLSAQEVSSALGVMGQSSALLDPAQVEYNILSAFPDIATARVDISLPAVVRVTVSERQPVAAWQQGDQLVWVDAQGYAFPARGLAEGLVTVTSTGAPPAPSNLNIDQNLGARPFLTHEMTTALMSLTPQVPQDAALIYDPRYGLGWTDPRGWQVYFGDSGGDMDTKLKVYQAMTDYLGQHEITPKLISVEYPGAPFYRMEN
jgi:hypothetical protein